MTLTLGQGENQFDISTIPAPTLTPTPTVTIATTTPTSTPTSVPPTQKEASNGMSSSPGPEGGVSISSGEISPQNDKPHEIEAAQTPTIEMESITGTPVSIPLTIPPTTPPQRVIPTTSAQEPIPSGNDVIVAIEILKSGFISGIGQI